jgi:cbb3-type cytochrome oxidase maturation protein
MRRRTRPPACAPRPERHGPIDIAMDILYLLVPLSIVLVFAIVGVLAWSVHRGQFDDLEQQGARILEDDDRARDDDQ